MKFYKNLLEYRNGLPIRCGNRTHLRYDLMPAKNLKLREDGVRDGNSGFKVNRLPLPRVTMIAWR